MSYTILDEAVDAVADKIDDGMIAEDAVDKTATAYEVSVEDILVEFTDAYLCSPQIYEQNRSADMTTKTEDFAAMEELEAADLDEISLAIVANEDIA